MLGSDSGRVPSGVTLDNWQAAPHLHWSFQHVADIVPTAAISRGSGPVAALGVMESAVEEIQVAHARGDGHADRTVGEIMQSTATDGWVISRHGVILAEDYYGGM